MLAGGTEASATSPIHTPDLGDLGKENSGLSVGVNAGCVRPELGVLQLAGQRTADEPAPSLH